MLFNDCLRCVGFRLATESVRSRSRFGVGVGVGDIRSAHTHSTQKEDTRRCADKIVMPPQKQMWTCVGPFCPVCLIYLIVLFLLLSLCVCACVCVDLFKHVSALCPFLFE